MKVRPAVDRMGPYKVPLESRTQGPNLLLDFNESTAPPSPRAVAAIKDYLDSGGVQAYPAYGNVLELLADYTGARPEQLILTNGSGQALDITMRALLEPGDQVITAVPTFPMTLQIPQAIGAELVRIPYPEDFQYPLGAVLDAVTPRTRLIVITNPNNPTGSSLNPARIKEVLTTHPNVPVLVDEAYYEFYGNTVLPLLDSFENLAIARTFSKAFAIAGLRLGYVISNRAFVEALYKVRGPYDVNILAVKAAEAQLAHPEDWRGYVREVMEVAKPAVERFFQERGVRYFKSDANFLLVQPDSVSDAVSYLKDNKILVRNMPPPIDHLFRVTIGTCSDMERFMETFGAYLGGA